MYGYYREKLHIDFWELSGKNKIVAQTFWVSVVA